jgi:uncharacterized protein YijF (DUF1287 family)
MRLSVKSLAGWLLCTPLGACEAHVEPAAAVPDRRVAPPRGTAEPERPALPAAEARRRAAPEMALGVQDRGIFSDLDARVQLALPAELDRSRLYARLDGAHQLLVLSDGDWPIKVYPSSEASGSVLELGAHRLRLRPGDHAELGPLLDASRVRSTALEASRADEAMPTNEAPPHPDTDGDGIPDPLDVLLGARKTALNADRYDGRYERIAYPLGDVPRDIGVCTDVVIRALRNAGIDLQRAVHEDIVRAPRAYPSVSRPNTSIDHRRVKSLLPYFERHFEAHSAAPTASDPYRPGDVVFMDTFPDRSGVEHVGIVSDRRNDRGAPLIINNWTDGTVTTDMDLLAWGVPVTHRFRVLPRASDAGASAASAPSGALAPAPPRAAGPIPADVTELVVVLSVGFGDWKARAQRYEREPGGPFRRVGTPLPAVLGGAGYGWGDGLHGRGAPPGRKGPVKSEGDRRSPAGVFSLGRVYGYAATAPALRLPYRQATADTRCVDDPGSPFYNQIVSIAETGERWQSAELMRRHDDLYELALEIAHNRAPVSAGGGSCIFAHVWAGPDVAVTGCTGFSKPDLRRLLEWLKPRSAAWVALPKDEYLALRTAWGLP